MIGAWTRASATLTLCGALLFAACSSGPEEGKEAEYWGEKAASSDVAMKDREVAMNHLRELKDPKSLPYLYKVLQGDKASLKPIAAQLVANMGDDTSIDPLIASVDWNAGAGTDKNSRAASTVNQRVAEALGRIGKGDDSRVVDALKRLAENNHANTQLAAIVSLGKIKAAGAVDDLIDIADGHTNNFMVKNACEALGDIGDAKAVPVLVKLLFFERTGVSFYREASYSLFQIGKPAIEPLVEVYNNKYKPIEDMHIEPGVQKAKALQILVDIGGYPGLEKICLAAAATPASDTANSLARVYGQQCVGRLGTKEAIPILKKYWDDLDQSVVEHAIFALAQMGAKDVAGELLAMTTFEGFVKQCMGLDKRNKRELCEEASPQVRPPRVIALSRLAPGSMVKDFEQMLAEEKDAKLKKEIEKGLTRVKAAAECDGKGTDCWIGLLKHQDPLYRERAGYELMWSEDKAAVPALLEALGDQDNEARYAAILAIWRMLPKEGVAKIDEILAREKGKTQFVRINEDLKRLRVKLERGY